MAEHEVTSPDQNKPTHVRAWYALWGAAVASLLVMLLGNHTGRVEDIFLIATAGVILAGVGFDYFQRRRNWK